MTCEEFRALCTQRRFTNAEAHAGMLHGTSCEACFRFARDRPPRPVNEGALVQRAAEFLYAVATDPELRP